VIPAATDKETPGDRQLARDVRSRLQAVKEAEVRLRDRSGLGSSLEWNYPVGIALHGPEPADVVASARRLAQLLRQSGKFTDAAADSALEPVPQLTLDVDREKCRAMGLELSDVFDTIQTLLGSASAGGGAGRALQVNVVTGNGRADAAAALKEAKVRNSKGELVPLGAVVAIRNVSGPAAIDRLDGRPMVEITANLAPGVSPAEARKLCERLAREAVRDVPAPEAYQLTWLRDMQ
jgi:multidrug efflux pump subunit AcrB